MKVRKKFDAQIEQFCEKIAVELYDKGTPPRTICKILEQKGIKGVTNGDIQYWRKKNGSVPKYRIETKPRVKATEAPTTSNNLIPDGYVILPKKNLEEVKELLNNILTQLEGLEYERE